MVQYILFTSIIISALFFVIITFKNKRGKYQKTLFSVYVLSLLYNCFMINMVKTGLILKYPHLLNTASSVNYLHLIVFLLLVRSILKDLKKPNKLDYRLLIIPVIFTITFIPFFLKTKEEKIILINKILDNPDEIFYLDSAIIPAFYNYTIQFTAGILCSFIAIIMILKLIKTVERKQIRPEFIWLLCVSSLMFLGNSLGLTTLIFDSETVEIHSLDALVFALYIIVIFSYPFFEPRILYGEFLKIKKIASNKTNQEIVFTETDLVFYKNQIDTFFLKESTYLSADFRQENLADFLNIKKGKLSKIIVSIYQKNFNQLTNTKRIEKVIENFNNSEWLNYSLDGVANQIGFKSRTTFIKAFKDSTGTTPSKYKKTILKK